jgi:hypothetical protein
VALPVVHFEIIGNDPQNLRDYYTSLFGWKFDTPSPVAEAVRTWELRFLDLVTAADGRGIPRWCRGRPRATTAMPSSTSASRMSRPHCSKRKARRHSGHGSRDLTERALCRSLQGPGGHPDRCRWLRMSAVSLTDHLRREPSRRRSRVRRALPLSPQGSSEVPSPTRTRRLLPTAARIVVAATVPWGACE